MKTHFKPLLIFFAASFLFLLLCYIYGAGKKSVSQSQIVSKITPGLPVRLKIPSINVDAVIQYVGVTPKGEMEVPSNATDVGWFKIGSRPGEAGSAVIAGHFDGKSGEPGVFFNLYKLKAGDKLYIEDDKGKTISFVVRESQVYNLGYADTVFSRNDGTYVNLITCDGVWDGAKKSYDKRLVVFTEKTP